MLEVPTSSRVSALCSRSGFLPKRRHGRTHKEIYAQSTQQNFGLVQDSSLRGTHRFNFVRGCRLIRVNYRVTLSPELIIVYQNHGHEREESSEISSELSSSVSNIRDLNRLDCILIKKPQMGDDSDLSYHGGLKKKANSWALRPPNEVMEMTKDIW